MTTDTGSTAIGSVSPTLSCSNSESFGGFRTGASGIALLHRMTAELIAKRREHPFGEWTVLAGSEAREQGGGDDRQRHGSFNRVLHGPAAFSGILDVPFETREAGVFGERACRELEQPGPDDAPVVPERRDRGEIDRVRARVHQLEALRVRLHESVLDAVVDHLHVVTGAVIADVQIAILRREREKDWLESRADVGFAADHQAVAFLQPPDPAAHARVDVVHV